MTRLTFVLTLALGAAIGTLAAAPPQVTKYGVTVTPEKGVDFTKFQTYAWRRGQPSFDKTIDAQIIAAVDRELARDMKKLAAEPADVVVTYASLTRTDVDLKGKPDAKGLLPQFPVGTLVITLHDPGSFRQLIRMRADLPIDVQRDKVEATINEAVQQMFAEYPTRKRK